MALLVSNTFGVSVAAAEPGSDPQKHADNLSKPGHNKEQKPDSKEEEEEEGGGDDGGGGGGGGLGGMLS